MILFLALTACGEPCLDTEVTVEIASDYAGPALQGVDVELEDGTVGSLDFEAAEADASDPADRWRFDAESGTTYNPLVSATLIFDDTNQALDVSDFEERSGGGGHTCENFFFTYVLQNAE